MRKSISKPRYGISWSPGRLTDLDFADDIVMLSDSHDIIQHMTDDLDTNAAKVGLCISCEKMKAVFVGNHLLRQSQLALAYFRVLKNSSILAATSPTSLILKLTYEQDQVKVHWFSSV